MKTFLKTTVAVLTIGLLGAFLGPQTRAAQIQGDIDFGGVITFDTTSLATATKVNTWNSSFVLQRSGDFANSTFSIDPGDPATMAAPWTFNSGTPVTPMPGPALPMLWKIGGFTFDLTSSMVVSQSATFLDVTGIGTISGNGFDPTPGAWSFNATQSDGSSNPNFSFQSQTTAIPEANVTALICLGGFVFAASRLIRTYHIR